MCISCEQQREPPAFKTTEAPTDHFITVTHAVTSHVIYFDSLLEDVFQLDVQWLEVIW